MKIVINTSQLPRVGAIKYHIHDMRGRRKWIWYKGIYFVDPKYEKRFVEIATSYLPQQCHK
jgi:hypothetical protein